MTKKIGCPDPKCYKTHYNIDEARACANRMRERISLSASKSEITHYFLKNQDHDAIRALTRLFSYLDEALEKRAATSFLNPPMGWGGFNRYTHFADSAGHSLCPFEGRRSILETDVTCPSCINKIGTYKAFGVKL